MTFRSDSGGQSDIAMFSAATYFDGHSRRSHVRYDAPALGPLSLSVDASTNDAWGAKGYVSTSLGGGALSLAIGYANGDNRFSTTRYGGSASYLASQGRQAFT